MPDLPGHRDETWSFLGDAARQLGFVAVGTAPTGPVLDAARETFEAWIADGRNASMRYLDRHRDQRCDPRHPGIVDGAAVVICTALPYAAGATAGGLWDHVAAHARARDYHATVRERLEALARTIEVRFPNCRWRAFVDTGPLLERTWATVAGLGGIGRHGGLIVPGTGARVVLGELVCARVPAIAVPPPRPRFGTCDGCDLCVTACPTGAIGSDGTIDARRCLSYQTIEDRGPLPPPEIERAARLVFGCDECTAACPLERGDVDCGLDPPPEQGPPVMDPSAIAAADPEGLASLIAGTCLERTGAETIRRNARAVAARMRAATRGFRGM